MQCKTRACAAKIIEGGGALVCRTRTGTSVGCAASAGRIGSVLLSCARRLRQSHVAHCALRCALRHLDLTARVRAHAGYTPTVEGGRVLHGGAPEARRHYAPPQDVIINEGRGGRPCQPDTLSGACATGAHEAVDGVPARSRRRGVRVLCAGGQGRRSATAATATRMPAPCAPRSLRS